MRKILILLSFALIPFCLHSQDWPANGTLVSGGATNIFGTRNNFPIRFYTNAGVINPGAGVLPRLYINERLNFNAPYFGGGLLGWLNGNYTPIGYTPMGTGFKPEGFVGINTNTPRTMLHISGPTNFGNGTGYRPWMSTGTYYSEHSNNMYVGMYRRPFNSLGEPTGGPVDGVVNWGDDIGGTGNRLRVIFTPTIGVLGGTPNAWERDMEMMSYWNTRNVGVGDFINFTTGPQRHLHVHNAFANSDYIQISTTGTLGGNTPTVSSGFHIGVSNNQAQLIQNENSHLIVYTNSATAASERMRITHVGAPGVTMPGVTPNSTRIGIPINPALTVSNPKSLIHLGFNGTATDGWRPWMEQGIFNSRATDHVYIGFKPEIGIADRNDAVIGWGDNDPAVVGGTGPDNLRFIFSKNQTVAGTASNGRDGFHGQEVGRFTPACDACPINKPSFGIGDFAPSGPQGPGTANYVDATLDVDGDVNIRSVQNNNALNQVLVRDPADKGRVYWRDAATLGAGGGVTADNGLSIQPAGNVQFGQDCNAIGNPGQLLNNREIPMVDNNIYLTGQNVNSGLNALSIGNNCSAPLLGRLDVLQQAPTTITIPTFGAYVLNTDVNSTVFANQFITGVSGGSIGQHPGFSQGTNVGVAGFASNGARNLGVRGHVVNNVNPQGTGNVGGEFISESIYGSNTGVVGLAFASVSSPFGQVVGVRGTANGLPSIGTGTTAVEGIAMNGNYVYGGIFRATGGDILNYGIYVEAPPIGPNDYAIYALGDVLCSGSTAAWSDSSMKTNLNQINNATDLLGQLNPYTYNYRVTDFPTMHLDNDLHFGLIAQNVESVIPELVGSFLTPQETDSLGNIIIPSQELKTVEYTEIIPILIAGFNEQSAEIASQDSIISSQDSVINNLQSQLNNFQTQLNDMMAMINNCCSQGNNINTPNINNNQTQFNVTNIDVKLSDNDCVLNVNSPNPFRDNTTITYTIPETANFAQIIFYNSLGQAIKIVDIDDKGAGRLNVYGEDLRSGMYSYSLIIDGNVCETHKMIKQ